MPDIRLKRIYDEPEPEDGLRILATRYWPRGVRKDHVDEYHSTLAPTGQLIKNYTAGKILWPEFEKLYRAELTGERQQAELRRLAGVAKTQTVTLMCFCKDEYLCHRTVLKQAIIEQMNVR